jgi:DNA-binding MarR family transcriptional regulator
MDKSSEILTQIRKIIRAIDLHSNKLVQRYNMTGPQLIICTTLISHGMLTVTDLAKEVHVSKATVVSILDRLTKKDYIERVRDNKDKRKVYVKPTERLVTFIKQNPPNLLQENFIKKFEGLEKWEQSLILASFERVSDMMNATEIEAAPIFHPDLSLQKNTTSTQEI